MEMTNFWISVFISPDGDPLSYFYSTFSVTLVAIIKMFQSEMLDNGGKLMPLRSVVEHV